LSSRCIVTGAVTSCARGLLDHAYCIKVYIIYKISAWIFRFWSLYRIIFKSCSVPAGSTLYSLYQMANIKTCAKCLWQPCMAAHIQIVTKFYPILGVQSRNILVQFGSSGLTYEFNFHSASRLTSFHLNPSIYTMNLS
jgi:hypothetical protein